MPAANCADILALISVARVAYEVQPARSFWASMPTSPTISGLPDAAAAERVVARSVGTGDEFEP